MASPGQLPQHQLKQILTTLRAHFPLPEPCAVPGTPRLFLGPLPALPGCASPCLQEFLCPLPLSRRVCWRGRRGQGPRLPRLLQPVLFVFFCGEKQHRAACEGFLRREEAGAAFRFPKIPLG